MQSQYTGSLARSCAVCGKTFYVRPSARKFRSASFCTLDCYWHRPKPSVEDVFWSHVDRASIDGCWPWTGTQSRGYGQFRLQRRNYRATRIAYELVAGPIPDDLLVLHTCDNPPCVRNDDEGVYEVNGIIRPRWGHLWLGTDADNAADKVAKGRQTIGSANGGARLTEPMVREIRLMRQSGLSAAKIAARLSVPMGTVNNVLYKDVWRHVQ
jgi:hypothetical protein